MKFKQKNRTNLRFMKRMILFSLLISLTMTGCDTTSNISGQTRFKNLVGHSITLKHPIKLYTIDKELDGYQDRYYLEGMSIAEDHPIVAVLPAGQKVFFQRAVRKNYTEISLEYLEGTLTFKKRIYPIYASIGPPDSDLQILLHYDWALTTKDRKHESIQNRFNKPNL